MAFEPQQLCVQARSHPSLPLILVQCLNYVPRSCGEAAEMAVLNGTRPDVCQVLEANLVLNDILNTVVHHAALAHERGRTTLQRRVPDGSDGAFDQPLKESTENGSRINFGGVAIGTGGEDVPVFMLDEFNIRNVSLLKIDAVRFIFDNGFGAAAGK